MSDPKETEPETAAPDLVTEPGGRAKVWLWVVIGLVLLATVFIVRRQDEPSLAPAVVTVQGETPDNGRIDALPADPR